MPRYEARILPRGMDDVCDVSVEIDGLETCGVLGVDTTICLGAYRFARALYREVANQEGRCVKTDMEGVYRVLPDLSFWCGTGNGTVERWVRMKGEAFEWRSQNRFDFGWLWGGASRMVMRLPKADELGAVEIARGDGRMSLSCGRKAFKWVSDEAKNVVGSLFIDWDKSKFKGHEDLMEMASRLMDTVE